MGYGLRVKGLTIGLGVRVTGYGLWVKGEGFNDRFRVRVKG